MTQEQTETVLDREGAEALAGQIMSAAAEIALREAMFLELLGQFDAAEGVRWQGEFASLAHWLSWSCSMAPRTAREHVRVARALRQMPRTAEAFARGQLSYSKVREMTRLVDDHDEKTVLALARASTASQLARTVRAYRSCPGTQEIREQRSHVRWANRDDGCVQISAVLSPEDGAAVIAALENAADDHCLESPQEGEETVPRDRAENVADVGRRSRVDGLIAMANHWLGTHPDDRSGEDRTTVVIDISADVLSDSSDDQLPTTTGEDGATVRPSGTCRVRGHSGIEPDTARRRSCEASVHAVVRDLDGEPLAVSRTQRFGTRAQRRALMVRDEHCQFPGCLRERHLKVHHVVSWLDGGPTDLDNLMLLCQFHHTAVHEGGITITAVPPPAQQSTTGSAPTIRWLFTRPDGSLIIPEVVGFGEPVPFEPIQDAYGRSITGERRERALERRERREAAHEARQRELAARTTTLRAQYEAVDRTTHADAQRLFPIGGGEGFSLVNCVEVLFGARSRSERQVGDPDVPAAA
ncbi:DUF222 domain-containing protein [Propionibacteriaceae bacterium Y1685]|uniref:HNH endonuclease signature motif containing protein n=1 Tax=Microlunatus sp. Y1700 TaxID=3418487 RepID=UPI003B7F1CD4